MEIVKLKNLNTFCPSQWEGTFIDKNQKEDFYARYRFGVLNIIWDESEYSIEVGDRLDGVMNDKDFTNIFNQIDKSEIVSTTISDSDVWKDLLDG
jgi:hypothetical protein